MNPSAMGPTWWTIKIGHCGGSHPNEQSRFKIDTTLRDVNGSILTLVHGGLGTKVNNENVEPNLDLEVELEWEPSMRRVRIHVQIKVGNDTEKKLSF